MTAVALHPTHSRSRCRLALVSAGLLTLGAAACTGGDPVSGPTAADGGGRAVGDIVVFAAASLTDSFTGLAADFETEHPGTRVVLNFGGSSALAQQIVGGAPVDVFAAASPVTMARVTDAGLAAGEPSVLARNRLEIAVPAGNPAGVTGLEDLADEDLTIALCAEEVPCGAASVRVFVAAGLTPAPDTYEQDVRAALTKVTLGEVDAALVYRTDVRAAGDAVEGLDLPESGEGVTAYPLVLLEDAPNPAGAQAFVEYLLGDPGREALGAAGFELP